LEEGGIVRGARQHGPCQVGALAAGSLWTVARRAVPQEQALPAIHIGLALVRVFLRNLLLIGLSGDAQNKEERQHPTCANHSGSPPGTGRKYNTVAEWLLRMSLPQQLYIRCQ